MPRQPGLDTLRAIAILWVMVFHAIIAQITLMLPEIAWFGWMGVDIFFVLSGYLIGWQLLKPYSQGDTPSLRTFYLRRAFRILPAYLVVVALYFGVPSFRETEEIQPLWQFLSFTENYFIDYFHNKAFSHVWSLCVEEHFYLVFPLLAALLMRKPSARRVVAVFVLFIVAGIAWRSGIWQLLLAPLKGLPYAEGSFGQRYMEWIYYPSHTRLDGLIAGVALATIRAFRPALWSRLGERANRITLIGLAGFATSVWLFQSRTGFSGASIGYPLLSWSLACFVLAATRRDSWLGARAIPGMTTVAAMAFSLYLSHKAMLHLAQTYVVLPNALDGALAFAVYVGAIALGGATLYLGVERPFLILRERLIGPERSQPATLEAQDARASSVA